MSDKQNGCLPEDPTWPELKLSQCMYTQTVRDIHAVIENEWDSVKLSACQTAAGRALWKHVINDPFAEILAGETYLRSLFEKMKKDRLNKAREISGVILAVRTLWFDSKIEAALDSFGGGETQVVLLGAGMDTRAYRLGCLKDCSVIEVDLPEVLEVKATLLHSDKNTIWVLEGILYYLSQSKAMDVLKIIADSCAITRTVLLADFMNKASTTLSSSTYQFYSDWPEDLLPPLGFSDVKLTQIGDPDAHFGLLHDPMNLFNKLRSLSRSIQTDPENGAPCCRLYLVQASGSPLQTEGEIKREKNLVMDEEIVSGFQYAFSQHHSSDSLSFCCLRILTTPSSLDSASSLTGSLSPSSDAGTQHSSEAI